MTTEEFNQVLETLSVEQLQAIINSKGEEKIGVLESQLNALTETVSGLNTRVDDIKNQPAKEKSEKEIFEEYLTSCPGLGKKK